METPFSLTRTFHLYRCIQGSSPSRFILLLILALFMTGSFMLISPMDNLIRSQILALISTIVIIQGTGLELIRIAIYQNGTNLFTLPANTSERLCAMLMLLVVYFLISVASCYIGFILLFSANTLLGGIFQVTWFTQTGVATDYCLRIGGMYLFNPLPLLMGTSHSAVSAPVMFLLLLSFCILSSLLCTVITRKHGWMISLFILFYTFSAVIFGFFIKSLYKGIDPTPWQAILLSPWLYVLLLVGIVGRLFYKLKNKQID